MFLREDQWLQLAPLLLGNKYSGGKTAKDNRLFIEAILWRVNTLKRWSDLPLEYGSWNTCYVRFRRWNESGIWRDLVIALNDFPELASEIQKIAAYGALSDVQAMARMRRKVSRKNRESQFSLSMEGSNNIVE